MGRSGDETRGLELSLAALDGHPADAEILGSGLVGREVEVVPEPGDLFHVAEEPLRSPGESFYSRLRWYACLLLSFCRGRRD